jgi:peptide/nickel transport system ATP-binding protein
MSERLLEVRNLHVGFSTRNGYVEAVRGVSFDLKPGATLGVVGESGSGKSVTAYAVTRLLERSGRVTSGEIRFRAQDLLRATVSDIKAIRGAAISMIFQNPRAALNPIRPVGLQIMDALSAHHRLLESEGRARATALLKDVRLSDPERVLNALPHELSGGMCQRVMIALAVASNPQLLIADEPTTGLDVTTQKAVMDLLAQLAAERDMGVILITHDLGLAARYCSDVAVMQNGQIVETANAAALFRSPQHPYTKRLVAASPTQYSTIDDLVANGSQHKRIGRAVVSMRKPLLDAHHLEKQFEKFQAVDDVSFSISTGESVGLVGESGSGKSTISRMICRLIDKTGGSIRFEGQDIGEVSAQTFHSHPMRRRIQIVFQDPNDSLNPRFSAFDSIAHPLRRLTARQDEKAVRTRVEECAVRVGLGTELLTRFPHQLSGGQKARVGIARAIATRPDLLVLDEPTAALDVSVQAVVLKLLDDLRREEGLSFLFVSHDLNVVRMMCERVIVLRNGKVVEEADSQTLFSAPRTAYTRELLEAIPQFNPNESVAVAS